MKTRLTIISIAVLVTAIIIFLIEYFIFGLNSKPKEVLLLNSPNAKYKAYVIDNPALDPPNQSLFVAKIGQNEFRLIEKLPEDIESVYKIYWSPDAKKVVFVTNWHLIITNVASLNSKKINLNPDWWVKNANQNTFSSSNRIITLKKFSFISSDSLKYITNEMTHFKTICIADL